VDRLNALSLPAVIIPVFNALPLLRACLDSLARHSPHARIVAIDDASSDPGVRSLLEAWAGAAAPREYRVNDRNRGFVYTANRGMREWAGDVVLLNADTVVTPGWLELLANCLDSDPDIATATPWSNNAEIVSLPRFCVAGPVPDDPDVVALAIRAGRPPVYPEIPTAVGFCMAISRAAIEAIGYFDEEAFGRGYGEENDFCLRAAAAGMRNVLCDNAYVAHHGGGSFAPLGLAPDKNSMHRLLGKHPGYAELIRNYIEQDPLSVRRAEVLADIQARAPGALEFAGQGGGY
jgi:GT2 family glycosyltransferase